MTERQQRVIELYHQGKTHREISQTLKAEANGRKGWGVSAVQVLRDIRSVQAYYQQQAVEHYADWLAKELSLAEHGHRLAARAFEASKQVKKERATTAGSGSGSITEETINSPGDPDFSREMREWAAWRVKLLGYYRENHQAPQNNEAPTDEPALSLAPYAEAISIFAASVAAQQPGNLRQNSPPQPLPAP